MALNVKGYRISNGMILNNSYHVISKISFGNTYVEDIVEVDETTSKCVMKKISENIAVVQVYPDKGAKDNQAQAADYYIVSLDNLESFNSDNLFSEAYKLVKSELQSSGHNYSVSDN